MSIYREKLESRKNAENLRRLRSVDHLLDFASNDSLGLSRSVLLKTNVLKECETLNRIGSTGSRLLTGNSTYAEELEQHIANYHGSEAGLLFSCGYMANLGLLTAIATTSDTILYDAQVHASTHDGIRLSHAQAHSFKHNNLNHLEERLKKRIGNTFVCIESIYSTDGSVAPLQEISALCAHYEAYLIVDEAHAVGVYGPAGKGLVEDQVFTKVVTFGKALGTYGAIVLGTQCLKDYLINFSRPFIYTTALPSPALAAIKCAYEILPNLHQEREKLHHIIHYFRNKLDTGSTTHIQPFHVQGNQQAHQLSHYLAQNGFDVRALTYPTVRRGSECLRICLHAFNTEEEIDRLVTLLKDLL